MPPKGFMYIFHLIGRKIFKKRQANEVEYGQTLSKKRRRNCVLKSVSSLEDDDRPPDLGDWIEAPYRIKFEFSTDDCDFRGSVLNFQKIDLTDACCRKDCCDRCFCGADAKSVSSDSACDIMSGSSCDDPECSPPKWAKPPAAQSSVEDFIRIHNEHFMKKWRRSERTGEPNYETLPRPSEPTSECDYDILLSRSNCNVLEPSYENLKLVENLYETPKNIDMRCAVVKKCSDDCAVRKVKDMVQANRTYDEVIESLKVLHSTSDAGKPEVCECDAEDGDNDINDYLENFKSYENDFSNDVESVSFQY